MKLPPYQPLALATLLSLATALGQNTNPVSSLPPSLPTSLTPTPAENQTPLIDPEHPLSSVPGETKAARDARMAWWREAKFGMFVHWGVYSVPAGKYGTNTNYGEWIMNSAKIPVAQYQAYAKDFNPVKFDAAKFVSAAKSAGMKYIVITSKHHDGFAMFDTKASDWSIVKATPYGKDPLKALAKECRKQGIKLGFYYSQAQDWNNGGSAAHGGHWDKAQDRDMDDYVDKIAIPQVTEILSHYGSDTPAVIWWDTPVSITKEQAARIDAVVQKLRPGLIQNNRLCHEKTPAGEKFFPGDTETPEQFVPPQGFPGRDWETCMTMNRHWGFNAYDQDWKSTETLIRNLCDIASKGGNYLLNVGPNSKGEIPDESIKRLAEIGNWMKVNSVAIYGSGPTPFNIVQGTYDPIKKDKHGNRIFYPEWNWRVSTKPGHLYLMVFAWPANGAITIPTFQHKIKKATLLADHKATLSVTQDDKGTTVSGLPTKAPDAIASVIDLQY